MKRAFVIVIDSMGCGALSDAKEFGDVMECNTLSNVAKFNGGLNIPNLQKLGLGNIVDIMGAPAVDNPLASFGIMKETSKGKCTTTGHWEMMGLPLDKPFKTFPQGFPQDIIDEFIEKTNCGGILANYPASGTKVIEDLHTEHDQTKFPIIYTSADSVFQIAVDIDIIPVETLYEWCRIARKILDEKTNVSRVIARPYRMTDGKPTRIGALRRDYSVVPFKDTTCDRVLKNNGIVVGIGKIEDIFVKKGISHAIHTGSNKEGLELTLKAFNRTLNLDEIKVAPFSENYDREFVFINLVDTDMLYGHRNDAKGYGKAIEEIDTYIPKFLETMTDEDLMIITADHGCDPTVAGTDHTREQVPVLVYSPSMKPQKLPEINCFDFVGKQVEKWLGC